MIESVVHDYCPNDFGSRNFESENIYMKSVVMSSAVNRKLWGVMAWVRFGSFAVLASHANLANRSIQTWPPEIPSSLENDAIVKTVPSLETGMEEVCYRILGSCLKRGNDDCSDENAIVRIRAFRFLRRASKKDA